MDVFSEYLSRIENPQHRARTKEVLEWIKQGFPKLETRIAWNQPMFTEHGTFIIGFSVAKQHLAISPELAGMVRFYDEIAKSGYGYSKMLFRIKWDEAVDFSLLDKIIRFNCQDKAECSTFWRK